MRRVSLTVAVLLLAISFSNRAQTAPPAKSGTATDIKNSEIQASAARPELVHVMRVIDLQDPKGPYRISIAVLQRGPKGDTIEEHSDITEIYHILSGTATFVTGGKIEDPHPDRPNPRIGPGFGGKDIHGGVSREVSAGDIIVIPPNTPHWFINVKSDKIVYTSMRIDAHGIASLGIPPEDAANAAAGAAAAQAATTVRP